jgi:hypothetical protein
MTLPSEPELQEDPEAEPQNLRFLRRLVTTLTVIMVGGLLAVVALLVIRLSAAQSAVLPQLPDQITLPAGESARAVTLGEGWIAVVTSSEKILILDANSGDLRQTIAIK